MHLINCFLLYVKLIKESAVNASDKQIKMNVDKFVSKGAGLDKAALESFEN